VLTWPSQHTLDRATRVCRQWQATLARHYRMPRMGYFFSSAWFAVSGARVGDPFSAPPAGVWL